MKIIYLNSTKPDLAWYRHYYRSVFPAGAKRAAEAYLTAINNLIDKPQIGPAAYNEIRRYSIQKTPFSIFYRVTKQHIEIVRIWDQRADPTKLELHEETSIVA